VVNQVIKGVSGVPGKKWNPEKPYGMTLVPGGALLWVSLMMI
jgi:hypothetical protein